MYIDKRIIALASLLILLVTTTLVANAMPSLQDAAAVDAQIGTAFTYQGTLNDNGSPANGSYDFQFILYEASRGGAQVGPTVDVDDVDVQDGRFTTRLDFGNVVQRTRSVAGNWRAAFVEFGIVTRLFLHASLLAAAPYASGFVPGAVVASDADAPVLSLINRTGDGLYVCANGDNHGCSPHPGRNGIEIGHAPLYGVYVDSAGADGIFVKSADHGVLLGTMSEAGFNATTVGIDGLFVGAAGRYGVNVNGDDLAGNFRGPIQVNGSCTGCLLATFVVNNSDQPLQPGDIVTVQGVQASGVDGVPVLMGVVQAAAGQQIVGVVEGRAELASTTSRVPTKSASNSFHARVQPSPATT
ncbi:MAG: hypothetical protein HC802_07065 [Caldilineaceae bacterium]|nr:hypothetical protein [Caldilineaceae bacterium]